MERKGNRKMTRREAPDFHRVVKDIPLGKGGWSWGLKNNKELGKHKAPGRLVQAEEAKSRSLKAGKILACSSQETEWRLERWIGARTRRSQATQALLALLVNLDLPFQVSGKLLRGPFWKYPSSFCVKTKFQSSRVGIGRPHRGLLQQSRQERIAGEILTGLLFYWGEERSGRSLVPVLGFWLNLILASWLENTALVY